MLCLNDSIRYDDPSLQRLLRAVEETHTLTARLLAVWPLARTLARHLVESVLAARAQAPTCWPPCRTCGTPLRSKGFATRQVTSLFGPLRWRRRIGRCPHGCDSPLVAPLDVALGLQPSQRSSGELQALGWALAVCVPCATAAQWLGWYSGAAVSPRAVWGWVQEAGCQAMAQLQASLQAVATGQLPPEEPRAEALSHVPLVIGADGVMVPFRPDGGQPRGTTPWCEVKVGVLARLGQPRTRTGQVVTRLAPRRLVAVLGGSEALKARLWLEAVRQGILHAPRVVWLSDGARGWWPRCEERCAGHATGMVDWSHAAQPRWKGAAAWLAGRTTPARRWFGWARHRRRHGPPDGVLADLAEA